MISTQAIAAVGYSLSALLLAFAAALYMGWLPANGGEPGALQQQAEQREIPVVKSPDRPAKTRVTDLAEEEPEAQPEPQPVPEPETAEREIEPTPLPAEEPEVPQVEPDIVEEVPPAEPQLPKSALILPREHHTPRAYPLVEPAAQEPETTEPVAESETAETEELQTAQEDTAEPTPETAREDVPSSEREAFETAEAPPETEAQTAPAPGDAAPKPEPEEPVIAEEATPKVRIIAPPKTVAPAEKSPSVVIRIPPRPEQELDVLPPPIAVPRGKPKIVERPPKAVAQAEEQVQRPAVPRAKPVPPQEAERPEPRPEPKVAFGKPAPKSPAPKTPAPKTPAPKTDALAAEAEDEPAVTETLNVPRPQAKPSWLIEPPTQTATVTPQPRRTPRATQNVQRKPRAKVQRQRPRASQQPRRARAKARNRRAKPVRVTIHRPPGSERVSFDQDTYCLAMAIYYEAGRKNLQQQVAISRDVLHRVESFNFPNSVCEVVYQYSHRRGRCRYAFACDGLPDRPKNKSLWRRAKVLASAHMACGSRCGCTLQKPARLSSSQDRNRRVIRCSANIRTPVDRSEPRGLAQAPQLRIKPVSSRRQSVPVSPLGRLLP